MNKTCLFRVFSFIGILMCINSFAQQTQNEKKLDVIVKILPELVEKGSCVVEVLKNGNETLKTDVPVGEKYTLHLDYFNKYTLIFKCPNHLDKAISVSTDIPAEIWQKNPEFPPFPMLITLVKKTTQNARNELCKTSVCVAYDKKVDNFVKVAVESE